MNSSSENNEAYSTSGVFSTIDPKARNVISGASAGIITTITLHPLDLLKTRLQRMRILRFKNLYII